VSGHVEQLLAVGGKIEWALNGWRTQMAELASKYKSAATFLYLGRGIHYAIAREGALKLKEASYVHAEGYRWGTEAWAQRTGERPRAPVCWPRWIAG